MAKQRDLGFVLQSGRDAGVSEKMERSDLLQQESNLRVREWVFGTFCAWTGATCV